MMECGNVELPLSYLCALVAPNIEKRRLAVAALHRSAPGSLDRGGEAHHIRAGEVA
jgi:hypothetical protein